MRGALSGIALRIDRANTVRQRWMVEPIPEKRVSGEVDGELEESV